MDLTTQLKIFEGLAQKAPELIAGFFSKVTIDKLTELIQMLPVEVQEKIKEAVKQLEINGK